MKLDNLEKIAEIGVDSGQIMLVDPGYVDDMWTNEEFQGIRSYRHKDTGVILSYGKDFAHFESPIPSQGGASMNTLLRSGGWEQMTCPPAKNPFSYNGCCLATLSKTLGGQAGVAAAVSSGYGDGCYPVYIRRSEDGCVAQVIVDFMGELENDDED